MIGIIGAMSVEVEALKAAMTDKSEEQISGIAFVCGVLCGREVVVAQCGIGKVFAAMAAQTMILRFGVDMIINTGVAGTLTGELGIADVAVSSACVQHDMDTSAIGDPVGLVSGINKIYFDADKRAVSILSKYADSHNVNYKVGTIASGDKFIAAKDDKTRIASTFGAIACEMEGASIAQVAYINSTPFAVVRAISDSADGDASMDYPTFLPIAVRISTELTLNLVREF